jgi:hypothetical protein
LYALRDETGAVDRRIAYLPPADASVATDMSLAETWAAGGIYVFLGRPANNDRALLNALRSWQAAAAPQNLRFLWIADPNAPPDLWRTNSIRVNKQQDLSGTVASAARIAFGQYAAVWAQGCTIALDESMLGFALAAPDKAPDKACLTVERRGTPPRYPIAAPGAALALRGPRAGALVFGLDIEVPQPDAPTFFDALDIGVRYFYPAPGESAGDFASLRYPIFAGRGALSLTAVLDPAAPLAERTAFWIAPGDEPLATFFRTTVGVGIALKPLASAALRFEILASASNETQTDLFYLAPAGDFEVVFPEAASAATQLLCGVCAAEYVGLAATGTVLSFVPGQAAFAPLFEPSPSTGDEAAVEAARLDFDARTSWISLTAPAALSYYAQPAGAVLYGGSTPASGALLPFFPVPAGKLPAASGTRSTLDNALPLVPYAGIDAGQADVALAFETEVLAQERRELVYELTQQVEASAPANSPLTQGGELAAVTPAGFVARFSADKETWKSLTLAHMDGQTLALTDVAGPLRAALLTNQQFLVISDARAFGQYFSEHRIGVQGWTFDLDPKMWQRHGTIVLIKNCARPVAELIADVGTWAFPEEFNASPALTQQSLERIVADARRAAATGGSRYDYFVNTVIDDLEWSGVLFLNCFVPPAELPAELHDLVAGLDEKLFYAHHLGINQTPLRGAGFDAGNSSMFGLIAYSDALRTPGSRDGGFDFQVLEIEVLFANSAIKHFSSSVAVTLMQMFGAHATAVGSNTGNALVLDGVYQRSGDRCKYVYLSHEDVVFQLDDSVLKSVKLVHAQFGSVTQGNNAEGEPGPDDTPTLAEFSFSGTLAFNELPARHPGASLDLFSYDELAFSKLVLEMRYPRNAPRATTFRLDPSDVAFDGAKPRKDSMASHFPLQPVAMIADGDAAQPADLGFMNVSVPDLDAMRLGARWFGLVFDLDLGTPGALAGTVGFTARLALVWSPATSAAPIFVGLKMPGSSGAANELSLMGVLKLTIYRLQLLHANNEFVLKLTGMTLKVMGKTLPPGATFDFFLFGDPAAAGGVTSLGWYGAYKRPADDDGAEEEDDDEGRLRGAAPARIERHPWSRARLLEALRDAPQE